MHLLYNIGIFLYYTIILVASIFNDKAKKWIDGRKNIFTRIKQKIDPSQKIIWFHAASLGEFEQGRPVIESFRTKYPDYKVLLTFFSPSGYEIRKDYEQVDFVFYLPIDSKKNAKKFIQIVSPDIAVFIKYEFWYNYINELKNNNIPIFTISAIFRKNQHFFQWYGAWFRTMLKNITYLFVQNQKSFDLLKSINMENMTIGGDTRFDRVYTIAEQANTFPLVQKFAGQHKVLLAGSTWSPGESLINQLLLNNQKIKLIIAPHEVHEERIKSILKLFETKNVLRYSEAEEKNIESADVLIIDQIGILSGLYQYCDIAYIGGGFGKGIHNILEAATYGKPVIIGPNYKKFKEAVDLIEIGGALPVSNETNLKEVFSKLTKDDEYYSMASSTCKTFIEENRGATDKILNKLSGYVK
ncbi:MAG: 3-deoxy-D-manno-octulosonic acid transferase [Deltaproteobacteria bacterium]|nr:MAG: 3-deoxy-D-manno-octulosonic acid transferase [Deltaproteobacteria bacterium]